MNLTDSLQIFTRSVRCPACGTIELMGAFKCPECGLFHASLPLEDRQAPEPGQRIQEREIDPTAYSLSSNSLPFDEEFQQTDEIKTWVGGNTDFSDLGEDEPLSKIDNESKELDVELIHED